MIILMKYQKVPTLHHQYFNLNLRNNHMIWIETSLPISRKTYQYITPNNIKKQLQTIGMTVVVDTTPPSISEEIEAANIQN